MNSNDRSLMNMGPKYQRISADLEQKIRLGVYTDKIPGERTLAAMYEANVLTVNKAVNVLVENNILERVKGQGTFVNRKEEARELFPVLCLHEVKDSITSHLFYTELFNSFNNIAHRNQMDLKIFNAALNNPGPTTTLLKNENGRLRTCLNSGEFLGGFLLFSNLELLQEELKVIPQPFVAICTGKHLTAGGVSNIVAIDYLTNEATALKYFQRQGMRRMGILSPYMPEEFPELTRIAGESAMEIQYFGAEVDACLGWSDGVLVEDDYFALANTFKLAKLPPNRLVCIKNKGFQFPFECTCIETSVQKISNVAWEILIHAIKNNMNKERITYVPGEFIPYEQATGPESDIFQQRNS